MAAAHKNSSLLSSSSLIQAPYITVKIGNYTFGVHNSSKATKKDSNGNYSSYNSKYPNYINRLSIVKINGQVNQYTLELSYPVRAEDDPNFFETVLSSVSKTRKIIFSYGDASMPNYIYKDEEAIITKVTNTFNFGSNGEAGSVIGYTIYATSSCALGKSGSYCFYNSGLKRPSEEIIKLFNATGDKYGLRALYTGMNSKNITTLIDCSDTPVELETKVDISVLDYINYLVSCMVPKGELKNNQSSAVYILTIHDDTIYDPDYKDSTVESGPYFRVDRLNDGSGCSAEHTDAYELDIGYNTRAIVTNLSITNNENYALYYDYQETLNPSSEVKRLGDDGEWEDVYAPASTSSGSHRLTLSSDTVWWTKVTKYPIAASITVQGLLRPALLMSYIRLNILFTGGHKHIYSGLYLVTKQQDDIGTNGYRTTLSLTKIDG